MSGETAEQVSAWTLDAWIQHTRIIRECDQALATERDRRYSEVNLEREKALRIKEVGDSKALDLERENRSYKDEKANNLREQITGERGQYATKDDLHASEDKILATMQPLIDYVSSQQGRREGLTSAQVSLFSVVGVLIAGAGVLVAVTAR